MKRVIYKYTLQLVETQDIHLPENAQILSVQYQHNAIVLWALIDPNDDLVRRKINIFGTGREMTQLPGRHIGTFQSASSHLVWHAFDAGPDPRALNSGPHA